MKKLIMTTVGLAFLATPAMAGWEWEINPRGNAVPTYDLSDVEARGENPYEWLRWRPLQGDYRLERSNGVYTLGSFEEIQEIVGEDGLPDRVQFRSYSGQTVYYRPDGVIIVTPSGESAAVHSIGSIIDDFVAHFEGTTYTTFDEAWDAFREAEDYPPALYDDIDVRGAAQDAWG